MKSCCTTLQAHAQIGIDLLCFYGEIDACSLDICMKIDTFVDFILTWINLPRQKIKMTAKPPYRNCFIPKVNQVIG